MQTSPYLNFNGQCEEAFQFYAKCFDGQIVAMIPHKGSPAEAQTPVNWQDKIMHARLIFKGNVLMGSDVPEGMYKQPEGFAVSVMVHDPADAERIFAALAEGATIRMPIQQTFWSPRFGMLTDRYGIPWMVNCEPAA